MNETPAQTPARSEVTAWPVRGSSRIAILTQGWGTGLARGALAFVAMAALGQVVAFAANLARSPGESAATAAKLGWLYFGWFHHAAVTTRVTSVEGVRVGGEAGLTANVGLAMMLGTFLAIAILYKGGRAVADGAGGSGVVARVLHGMKVAPAYAIPRIPCVTARDHRHPHPAERAGGGEPSDAIGGLSWFMLPLLIAVAAGAAGGLRSGRYELVSHDPWGRRASGVMAGGLRMFVLGLVLSFGGLLVLAAIRPGATMTYFETVSGPPTDQTTMNIAHHVLLLPNQSMWVLVPAMGGCDGLSGGGVSATFLCYSKVPTTVSVTPEGLNSDTPAVQADFAKAPSGSLLFLLVPAVSVVLGGRYAARKRARLKWEAIAMGAASGVVFAVLVALGSWLASISAGLSSPTGGISANASVLIGPAVGPPGSWRSRGGSSAVHSGDGSGAGSSQPGRYPSPRPRASSPGGARMQPNRDRVPARQGMAKTAGSSKAESPGHVRPRLGVVVVDPLAVVRAGLGMLIGDQPDMQVLAETGTADECLAAVRRIRRSQLVVLVGLDLPGERDSLWLIGTLRERYPHATILASGAGADATTISRGLFLGADGYLDKDVDPVEFLQAIRQAARGEAVLAGAPVDWVGSLADGFDRTRHIESRLTRREQEVLKVAAEGLTAREIARHLGVRERTVTTHLGRIYGKLGVNSRAWRGDRGGAIRSRHGWLLGRRLKVTINPTRTARPDANHGRCEARRLRRVHVQMAEAPVDVRSQGVNDERHRPGWFSSSRNAPSRPQNARRCRVRLHPRVRLHGPDRRRRSSRPISSGEGRPR